MACAKSANSETALSRRDLAATTTPSANRVTSITISALIVGLSQLIFLYNVFWSLRHGKKAEKNPWGATSLEWQTPDVPPHHGNWGPELPTVHRWAYDFSVPGAEHDFIPQNHPVSVEEQTAGDEGERM